MTSITAKRQPDGTYIIKIDGQYHSTYTCYSEANQYVETFQFKHIEPSKFRAQPRVTSNLRGF